MSRDPREDILVAQANLVLRHSLLVRLTHWINLLCMSILLMSGLQILNAHPAFYLGNTSDFEHPLFSVVTWPGWITIPGYHDLGMGRQWHFFFAWLFVVNGLVYGLHSLLTGHLWRDLIPKQFSFAVIVHAIQEHLALRFPKGDEARHYNVLQQLAYLVVLFVLIPLMIATGLSMSPQMNASWPWLPALLGGRQTARTLHFLAASGLFAFFLVHIVMVLVSGAWNNLRSMITGRYSIADGAGHAHND